MGDITACGETILGEASLPSTSALLPLLDDISGVDVLSSEIMPIDATSEPSMTQPCSEAKRSLFRRALGLCNPFKRERPKFPRKIIDMVSYFLGTSFGTILLSSLTLLENARVIHRRQSTGKRSLRSLPSPLPFIVVLASVVSAATASPLHNAEGSLSTTPATSTGLYFAWGIPIGTGIIVCCVTWRHRFVNSSWRNCLGVLSLMASILWTCFVHWDTAPRFRYVVLACCHGLIYNFTLQLCVSSQFRILLPEAWAINVGFPVAALLVDFLGSLLVGQEPATMPSSVTDLIRSGFLHWATSPLQFTSWAILVKVAFYTCEAVIGRHTPPAPNTLLGRGAVRIAFYVERLYGRICTTIQQHHPGQGRITANGHNAAVGDGDMELGDMASYAAPNEEQSNGNNQGLPVEVSSPRTRS